MSDFKFLFSNQLYFFGWIVSDINPLILIVFLLRYLQLTIKISNVALWIKSTSVQKMSIFPFNNFLRYDLPLCLKQCPGNPFSRSDVKSDWTGLVSFKISHWFKKPPHLCLKESEQRFFLLVRFIRALTVGTISWWVSIRRGNYF
jgi:hypothetical protein